MITNKKAVICDYESPTVLGYINLYEIGDAWIKIKGCEACENAGSCCGSCPLLLPSGKCPFHTRWGSGKPYRCVIQPSPENANSKCALEFECIQGTHKGKIRRVKDIRDVFKDKETT